MSAPRRIQMTRQRPWRAEHPDAVIVARPGKWGNPYRVGETQMRYPCADGREAWEHEGRLHKPSGQKAAFFHGDGTVTWHEVRDATVAECVDLYREHLERWRPDLAERARAELAGRDLACWCPLEDKRGNRMPCHADVLLELANPTPKETPDA